MKARRLPLRMGCGEPLEARRLRHLRRPVPSRPRREEKRS